MLRTLQRLPIILKVETKALIMQPSSYSYNKTNVVLEEKKALQWPSGACTQCPGPPFSLSPHAPQPRSGHTRPPAARLTRRAHTCLSPREPPPSPPSSLPRNEAFLGHSTSTAILPVPTPSLLSPLYSPLFSPYHLLPSNVLDHWLVYRCLLFIVFLPPLECHFQMGRASSLVHSLMDPYHLERDMHSGNTCGMND